MPPCELWIQYLGREHGDPQPDGHLRPVTTAQAILDTTEQEAEGPSNPQTQWDLGPEPSCPSLQPPQLHPSQNILGGAGSDL